MHREVERLGWDADPRTDPLDKIGNIGGEQA